MTALRWDVFCHVVDNHGDLGVCWRLARQLAALGRSVRLFVDDARALAWMAPGGAPGVEVRPWQDAEAAWPGDVVVETFGAAPPDAFLRRIAGAGPAVTWIDVEYLSAEAYVERSHRLPSPQWHGPAAGAVRHFFYPGFTPSTGGLLREPGLRARRDAFDRAAWRARVGGDAAAAGGTWVSVFAYPDAPLAPLLSALRIGEPAGEWPGPVTVAIPPLADADRLADAAAARPGVRALRLPWLTQDEYDHLLWAGDLNLVRGEDSAVRAMWAGRPFLWQLYPQDDGAHGPKLEAFLHRWRTDAGTAPGDAVEALLRRWNGVPHAASTAAREPAGWPAIPPSRAHWAAAATAWSDRLAALPDAATSLLEFALQLRGAART